MIAKFLSRLVQARKERQVIPDPGLDLYLVEASDLFDKEWYLKKYPDVAEAGVDPLWHFLNYGGFEGRNPGPNFFSRWYLNTYEDVKKNGMNPLVHYLRYGRDEGRDPRPPAYQLGRRDDDSPATNSSEFEVSSAGKRLFKGTNDHPLHADPEFVPEELPKHAQFMHEQERLNRQHADILVDEKIPEAIKNATKIFIVGPPRSGTTLVYSMIANDLFLPESTFVSNLMRTFVETYKFSDKPTFEYYGHTLANLAEVFKKPIYDFLYTASLKVGGASQGRFIYKDPSLTLYLEFFPLFFDDSYKVVFCVRDPRDVIASMVEVLQKQNRDTNSHALFEEAIEFIFPFYKKIYDFDHKTDDTGRDKIILVKYEDLVTGRDGTLRALETFLGMTVSPSGVNESIKGRLDETSPFYSENYGKAIKTSPVGRYKNSLTAEQIAKIETDFGYYMERFSYE